MDMFKYIKKGTKSENEGGTLLHKKLSFAATEAYKLLRANLMFTLAGEEGCRIVGVTSSMRGEGKSTTAVNLSYTLAETGKKVLLVDADLRLPSVAKKLEIKLVPGLSNLLADPDNTKDAVRKSNILENWDILPAGDIPPNPTEMLGSTQMEKLIEKLSGDYDYIILDLPPVNIVSDALVVSKLLSGMLVVVRENYSQRRELKNCMRQLELSSTKVLGYVLNIKGDEKSISKKSKYAKVNSGYGESFDKIASKTEESK